MTIYSYSRLGAYENCPLQYKLHYIDKITTKEEGVEAFMGSRVHETLEKLYKELIHSKMNTVEELVEFYNEQWDKEWHDEVKITKEGRIATDYKKTGDRAIREYYARYHPFDQSKTLWTQSNENIRIGSEKIKKSNEQNLKFSRLKLNLDVSVSNKLDDKWLHFFPTC